MNLIKAKKVVAAGLSALMMMTSTTSVFAAESGDKSANLNYQVSSSYDWIIHSSIDFGADVGVKHTVDRTGNQVKVLKNVIPEGKYLNISVKGSGANDAFTVNNGGSEVLNYDVSDDNGAVGVNGNVLSVPAGTNTATQNMNFKLNTRKAGAEVAGQYDGQVIYNAELGGKDDIIQKEKSSKLITGEEFNKKIPSSATTVVFTNEKAPEGVETTSLSQEGDVVGWLDGTTWKVSTQDSSKVVNFNENSSEMFSYKKGLTNINFNNVDTSNATDMWGMFFSCTNLTSLDLSSFSTSNVTDMSAMFYDCSKLTSLNLSNFNTSKVADINKMFYKCTNLSSLDLSDFDTSKVTNMYGMFNGCTNLTSLDLSSFDTSKVTKMTYMFSDCSNLTNIYVSSKWSTNNVDNMWLNNGEDMFVSCKKLPNYDASVIDVTKAHTGPGGYLTLKQ